MELVMIGGE